MAILRLLIRSITLRLLPLRELEKDLNRRLLLVGHPHHPLQQKLLQTFRNVVLQIHSIATRCITTTARIQQRLQQQQHQQTFVRIPRIRLFMQHQRQKLPPQQQFVLSQLRLASSMRRIKVTNPRPGQAR